MDLFTHIVVAYLATYGAVGLQPQYLAAGALAGGLPDADALLFPLARRWPILRHHGITHSLLGVTILALAGALIAPLILPGSPLLYFAVMELGGGAHILQDGFTNFSVPPLLPFSRQRLELDADRAINFVTLVVSVVALVVLLDIERGHVALAIYVATLWALTAFFAAYFAIRLAGRIVVGRRLRALGGFTQVLPTSNPFVWLVVRETKDGGRMRLGYARYVFGRGVTHGPFEVDAALVPSPDEAPIDSPQQALDRSYGLASARHRWRDEMYLFGYAEPDAGGWLATWFSLEFGMFGRTMGVEVRFPKEGGSPVVKQVWRRLPARWGV